MREDKSVTDAKKCLKSHIKFFESLLKHINGDDLAFKGRAMWTSWCLHNYMNNQLMVDVEKAITGSANTDTGFNMTLVEKLAKE
jgi:hypothetical protein